MSNQGPESPNSLAEALDHLKPSSLLRYDLLLGLLGGGGAVWLALENPQRLRELVGTAAQFVGVVVAAVVAGLAVMSAFLDQSFLRKLRAINKEPVRYFAPLLFTAALGVVASLSLLVFMALPPEPVWLQATFAGISGLLVVWTLASLLPNLSVLVQFLGLQFDASDVPDHPPSNPGEGDDDSPHSPLARRVS